MKGRGNKGKSKEQYMSSQRVEFETQDAVKIAADYYPAEGSSKGVVLVHMMPATRQSWRELGARLQESGYHALAIDLRGHGESGGGDYRQFSEAEHQASIHDLEAAAKFLQDKGVISLVFAGASIGANLALQYLAQNPETKAAVLLSPGVDYHGIEIEPLAKQISEKQKILFVGAEDDAGTMGGSCEEIAELLQAQSKICYPEGGHGTNLFQSHEELMEQMMSFLKERF